MATSTAVVTAVQVRPAYITSDSNPSRNSCSVVYPRRRLFRTIVKCGHTPVAQYASDAGNGKAAFTEVDQCLRALEELDSRLLRASRKDSGASIESMKLNVDTALNALNSLLKTVPLDVLDKGKAMAEAYLTPSEDLAPETPVDPQLKQLESILL